MEHEPLPVKCVMVIDESLPLGLQINTAGCLGLTLGYRVESIIGPDAADGSGQLHLGLTRLPIPILKASEAALRELWSRAHSIPGLLVVDFSDVAQSQVDYAAYQHAIAATPSSDLRYLGLALYGEKKAIKRLTGSLPLLR